MPSLNKSFRLRTQLIVFFTLLVGFLLLIAGVYVDWQLRRVVEREIKERLLTVAQLAAHRAAETPVVNLLPGDESSRTMQRLQREFAAFTASAGLARLVIADSAYHVYFDSRGEIPIGGEYVRLRFDALEMAHAFAGEPTTAVLFYDTANQPFKAAYAPVVVDNKPVAVACVEGSVASLSAVRDTRRMLLTIGLIAISVAVISAGVISRQVTRPLEKLMHTAEAIGRGDYIRVLAHSGSREVAVLAQTMEEMRRAVVQRHQRQQMMLAGIAHEIRNPLGGIELFAGLLQKQAPAKNQAAVEKILLELRRLEQIVQDFLEYARPSEVQRRTVNLAAAIEEARELLPEMANGVQWQIEINNDLRLLVDPEHLRRILLNLLRNASEAMAEQKQKIICLTAEPAGNMVHLTITDNGPGIAPENVEKIFEPFFTTRSSGTGLGLALVKLLAEENGGHVALRRRIDGASFELELPRQAQS